MLKKHGWIVVLFLAIAMVFMGCPGGDPDDDDGREVEFHWLMTEDFFTTERWENAVEEGWINEETGLIVWAQRQNFFEPELAAASSANDQTFTVVDNDGKPALEVFTGEAVWGVGFDLQNSFFDFHVGDQIIVTGKVLNGTAAPMFVSATAGSGETHPAVVGADGNFTVDFTLTQAHVNSISTSSGDSPAAIRIGAKPAGIRFVIYEVEVITAGYVPTEPVYVTGITGVPGVAYVGIPLNLGTASMQPPLAHTVHTVVWSKQADPGTAAYTLTEEGVLTATTEGTAEITATIANGWEAGDATYDFTIDIHAVATALTISVAGENQDVAISAQGTANVALFTDGSGYTITVGSSEYEDSWAKFTVDLGDAALADFEFVKATIKSILPNSTGGWKDLGLLAAETLPATLPVNAQNSSNAIHSGITLTTPTGESVTNTGAQGSTRTYYFAIDNEKAAAIDGSEVELSIFIRAETGWAFEVSNIQLILGDICDECGQFPCICYAPVVSIPVTQTHGFVGVPIHLPTHALPTTATNRNIVWSVKSGAATIDDGKATATAAGTIELTATIANGETPTTPKTFDISIGIAAVPAPLGSLTISDFSVRSFGYGSENIGGNTWRLNGNYQRAGFSLAAPITNAQYEKVIITYTGDYQLRFGFFEGTPPASGSYNPIGGNSGWTYLNANHTSREINLPAGTITGFAIESATPNATIAHIVHVSFVEPSVGGGLPCGCECTACEVAEECDGTNCSDALDCGCSCCISVVWRRDQFGTPGQEFNAGGSNWIMNPFQLSGGENGVTGVVQNDNSLLVTGRTSDFHGLTIVMGKGNANGVESPSVADGALDDSKTYAWVVSGIGGASSGDQTSYNIGFLDGSGNALQPEGVAEVPIAGGSFFLVYTFTGDHATNLNIRTNWKDGNNGNPGKADFTITEIALVEILIP